jgi:hypothetical protein
MTQSDPLPARAPSGDAGDPGVPAAATRRSNRGFWIIAAALGIVGAFVVVGAILTRPEPPGSSARLNLERAVRAANIVQREGGSYAAATADEVGVVEVTLTFVSGDRPSDGPTVVSVHPEDRAWVAAALASDGSCRSVRVESNAPSGVMLEREVAAGVRCSADAVATHESVAAAVP